MIWQVLILKNQLRGELFTVLECHDLFRIFENI